MVHDFPLAASNYASDQEITVDVNLYTHQSQECHYLTLASSLLGCIKFILISVAGILIIPRSLV
jgi:hypothetical protein